MEFGSELGTLHFFLKMGQAASTIADLPLSTASISAGIAAVVALVELFTPANPIKNSLRLLTQFRSQVQNTHC